MPAPEPRGRALLKPIHWRTFPRDFAVIQLGFALFGLAIALLIHANLGASAWAVLEVALSRLTGLTVGTASIVVGLAVLGVALGLREQVGWGTVANIFSIGPWLDLGLWAVPEAVDQPAVQIGYLLAAVGLMGVASALYIGVDAGAGPRDSLMLALHRTLGVSVRLARGAIELSVLAVGWALGGPVGVGTVVFAVLIGPAVQAAFRIFKVRPAAAAAPVTD